MGYTRRCSESRSGRKTYVSLDLVRSYRVDLRLYREISHARAHDDVLDDRARHPGLDCRRRRQPHFFAPHKFTLPSRRPHLLHPGRHTGALHLL